MKLVAFIVMLVWSLGVSAQMIQDSVRTYFPQGVSRVDTMFGENGKALSSLSSKYRLYASSPHYLLKHVRVVSSASPEGSERLNIRLSRKRADALLAILQEHVPIPEELLEVHSLGVDWEGLARWVRILPDVPYREQVLDLLEQPMDSKVRKARLEKLEGGESYRWLYAHVFPLLRQSHVVFLVKKVPELKLPERISLAVPLPSMEIMPVQSKPVMVEPERSSAKRPLYWALKTNALYDLALVPNVGVEVALGKDWSVAANWMYAWWSNSSHNNFWRIYGGEVEVRRWLGKKDGHTPLQGHHLGIYGQMVTYDFELGGRGYLADKWTYGAGLSYGYSLPIARRLNLDFSIGLGYLGGVYKEYLPIEGHYVWQVTKRLNWFGPTKAEVSLVWLLGGKNGTKKGGAR